MVKKAEKELSDKTVQEDLPLIRAWVVREVRGENGNLRGVLICSAPLEDHLWLILDRSFEPNDELAVYYPEELPALKTKSLEDLRAIHMTKLELRSRGLIKPAED